jgi:cob(I)alamin adenosyltransferase
MNMTITGEIKVLVGPSKDVTQQVLIEGIRRGSGALMAEFLRGGLGQGPDKPVFMGEFKLVRPSIDGEIDPQAFSVEEKTAVLKLWESVKQQVNECNFVILDGIGEAISSGLIPRSAVLDLILQKPARVDVLLTGSTMPNSIKALASEIRKLGEGAK